MDFRGIWAMLLVVILVASALGVVVWKASDRCQQHATSMGGARWEMPMGLGCVVVMPDGTMRKPR